MKKWIVAAIGISCGQPLWAAGTGYQAGSHVLSLQFGGSGSGNEFDWSDASSAGKEEEIADGGAAIGGQYVYYLKAKPAVGIGLDVTHSGLEDHEGSQVLPGLDSNSNFKPTTVMAISKLSFPSGVVRPYIFGGLGFHSTTMLLELTPTTALGWGGGDRSTRKIVDGTGTGLAVGFGIGADFYPTDAFFIGLELRGAYLGTADYGVTTEGRALGFDEAEDDLSVSSLLIRAGFKF